MKHRIQSTLVLAALLLAAAVWLPPAGVLVVLLLISTLGTLEFYGLLDHAGVLHFKIVGTVGGALLITVTWICLRYRTLSAAYEFEWIVLFVITVVVLLRQFPQKHNQRPLETIGSTLLGVMYMPFMFNFFTKLLMTWDQWTGRMMVLYLIAVVKAGDVSAYVVGCSLGRHKLIPRISPLKTWEGCAGGILGGMVVSLLFRLCAGNDLGDMPFRLSDALILGGVLPAVGIIGDLTESLLKRAAGVKDSGHLIAGMGGVLDLIDSLLFAVPALYIYARLFMK